MKSKTTLAGLAVVGALALGGSQLASAAAVTNGSFETGDFTGWTTQDLASPFFPLSIQTAGSANTFGWSWSSTPTDGLFTAFSGFDGNGPLGPNPIRIAQNIGVVSAGQDVSFDYRAAWDLVNFGGGTLNRLFDVVVYSDGTFTTTLGSVNFITAAPLTFVDDTGALSGSVDLTPFAGLDVWLSFELNVPENFTGPAQFQLDNIVISQEVPAPAPLALLGLGLVALGIARRKQA